MSDDYILDCTFNTEMGLYCFCPITFNEDGTVESIVVGMNYLSTEPPDGGYFVGVIHSDGQEACDVWCAAHEDFLHDLYVRRGKTPEPVA